jgi:hypothetical protein
MQNFPSHDADTNHHHFYFEVFKFHLESLDPYHNLLNKDNLQVRLDQPHILVDYWVNLIDVFDN